MRARAVGALSSVSVETKPHEPLKHDTQLGIAAIMVRNVTGTSSVRWHG